MQNTNTNDNASEQTQPAFTPGPWTSNQGFLIQPGEENSYAGEPIADVFYRGYDLRKTKTNYSDKVLAANARLIACAPEMLAKLEEVQTVFEDGGEYGLADEIANIIAKAKGEQGEQMKGGK